VEGKEGSRGPPPPPDPSREGGRREEGEPGAERGERIAKRLEPEERFSRGAGCRNNLFPPE
jgi:hypothetical protein